MQARTHAADGAGVGGALGGVVGAALATIIAVGSTIVLPGLNLVIAGPIVAALAEPVRGQQQGRYRCSSSAQAYPSIAPRFTKPAY